MFLSLHLVLLDLLYLLTTGGGFQPGKDTLLSLNPDNLGEIPQYRLGLNIELYIQLDIIKC